jgi:hypothetical protein
LRALVLVGVVSCFVIVTGCSKATGVPLDPTVPVQGNVQLDGKPLAEGEISFAIDGKPAQISPITNGAYSGKALVGQNRVSVAVYKTETDSMTNDPVKVNTLPPRFNTQSTLSATVAESGANQFDFQVQSK